MPMVTHPLAEHVFKADVPITADLAELAGFNSKVDGIDSIDPRSSSDLRSVAFEHSSAMERERAAWELAYREPAAAAALVIEAMARETDRSVRWNYLWLAMKLAGDAAMGVATRALSDSDREVRDWARLYRSQLLGEAFVSEYDEGAINPNATFDQTLPLQIAGHVLVNIPAIGPRRAILSPLWFEYILGRVLACTNARTFMNDLVIEKRLEKYNNDGSDHFEIFKFSGLSWPTPDGRVQHRYESYSLRDYYHSGKVKDFSAPHDPEVPVILSRAATTSTSAIRTRPVEDFRDSLRDRFPTPAAGGAGSGDGGDWGGPRFLPDREIRLLNGRVVRDVRGQFFGWAATSLEHFLREGAVLPGTVQLANPLHEGTRESVNTYLCGTFRGKLGDFDGDGLADVNLIPCHGTVAGELDLDLDGLADNDPFIPR